MEYYIGSDMENEIQDTPEEREATTTSDERPVKKPPPRKRERKEYMQQYYQKHKQESECLGCGRVFSCIRALKHHERNNISCQLACLEGIYRDALKEGIPLEKQEPLLLQMQQLFELNQQRKARNRKENLKNIN